MPSCVPFPFQKIFLALLPQWYRSSDTMRDKVSWLRALIYHRAMLPAYTFLSSASKLCDCTFLPFWHNYFSYFIIHVLRFRLMILMSKIKYCLCTQSPADSSSFCTKLAQDQLASKNSFQPSLPKETGFYEAWHMPSKLFHRFQCHNDLLSQNMVKETNVKSSIVFDMAIKGHCYLLNA